MVEQVQIGARVKPIPHVEDLPFKDLNGEGQFEPYGDCWLSPAERVADPAQRVPPSEKIGLR